MPFCTKCGAEVAGRFCIKCGSPVAAPAAPDVSPDAATRLAMPAAMPSRPATPPPPAAPPAAAPMAAAPVRKKTSPLVWVLVAVLGFFFLIGIAVVGAGFFFVHKAKQAGFDPDLMKNNPGLAVTKMLAAANPDIEVVRVDDRKGLITLREKSTGKTTTVDFEAVKQGRISFTDDKGESLTLGGDNNGFEAKSSDGSSLKFGDGANVKVPSWIPTYPGATIQGKYSGTSEKGEAGAFGFTTRDPAKKVIDFYTQGFKSGGMEVTSPSNDGGGDTPGGIITVTDGSKTRTALVSVATENGATSVGVTFEIKK